MEIIKRDECEPFITKDTSEIRELMAHRNSSCKNMSLAEATLKPGGCTQAHYHNEVEEIYYFLSGIGRINIDGEEKEVVPGDTVMICPGQVHKTWNTGEADLIFLCCCSPAYEHDSTVMVKE